MKRRTFIKKGLLGAGMLAAGSTLGKILPDGLNPEMAEERITGNIMARTILHKADSRGLANHGWLQSRHSFSFANYYNPERMSFGVLRVLNDDTVAAGMGFGTHPHDNMEIISIPLQGDLEHKDSMGNVQVIRRGDIQVMSAGTGIRHSEYNRSKDEIVKFLQIWVIPNKRGVEPRYDQMKLDLDSQPNTLVQVLSPNPEDAGVWIHQDAWFNMGKFAQGKSANYTIQNAGNGLYAFVLEGKFELNGQQLDARDGFGIWETENIELKSLADNSEILLMDVPMR